jgi:hypothetical protein
MACAGLQEELKCMPLGPQKILGQPIPLKRAAFMAASASPVSFMHYSAGKHKLKVDVKGLNLPAKKNRTDQSILNLKLNL